MNLAHSPFHVGINLILAFAKLIVIYGNKIIGYIDQTGLVENIPFKVIAQGAYDPEAAKAEAAFAKRERAAKELFEQGYDKAKKAFQDQYQEAKDTLEDKNAFTKNEKGEYTLNATDATIEAFAVNTKAHAEAKAIFDANKDAFPMEEVEAEKDEADYMAMMLKIKQKRFTETNKVKTLAASRDAGDEKKLVRQLTKVQRIIKVRNAALPPFPLLCLLLPNDYKLRFVS